MQVGAPFIVMHLESTLCCIARCDRRLRHLLQPAAGPAAAGVTRQFVMTHLYVTGCNLQRDPKLAHPLHPVCLSFHNTHTQVPPASNASSHHAASLEPHLSLRHPSDSSCCGNASAAAAALGSPTLQLPLEQQQQHVSSQNLSGPQQQQQQCGEAEEDCGEGAVVTTQRLRAAVAPETVLQVSRTPLEQIAVELREVTQKMALLRLAGTGEGVSMSGERMENCTPTVAVAGHTIELREGNVVACLCLSCRRHRWGCGGVAG
jgi:hypothetical protein